MTDKETIDYCKNCSVEPPALKFKCPECEHNPDKEQIIEYPHCQSCLEYNICKVKGLNRYRPKYLNKTSCRNDCAYDHKCYFGGTPYKCPEFREWCYNDMDVAKEFGHKGCYRKSLNANKCFKDFKNFIALTIEKGKILWAKIKRN